MISIVSRVLEWLTERPVLFPIGEPARLIQTLGDRIDGRGRRARAGELQRDRVELDAGVQEERWQLQHADLERAARQALAA